MDYLLEARWDRNFRRHLTGTRLGRKIESVSLQGPLMSTGADLSYLKPEYDDADLRRVEAENKGAFEEAAKPYRLGSKAVVNLALGWLGVSVSEDHPYAGPVPATAASMLGGVTRSVGDDIARLMGAFNSPPCRRYLLATAMQAESAFLVARFGDLGSLARGDKCFFDTGLDGQGTYHTAPVFILFTGLVCRNRDVQSAHRRQLHELRGADSFYERVACCLNEAERRCLKASYEERLGNVSSCPMTACCWFMSEEIKLLNTVYGKRLHPKTDYLRFRNHLSAVLPGLRNHFQKACST